MENKVICRRISSILSLYIDNQVTYQERAFIEDHLSNCSECRKKYLYLKSLIKDLKSSYRLVLEAAKKKQEQKVFNIREHEKFLNRLYPYIDNELSEEENDEFKKYLANSKNAQRELKSIYKIQKELRGSYNKRKKSLKKDFSQTIINQLKNNTYSENKIINLKNFFISGKAVKIAILSGLIIFCGYEIDYLYKEQHKPKTEEQIVVQSEINSQQNLSNSRQK